MNVSSEQDASVLSCEAKHEARTPVHISELKRPATEHNRLRRLWILQTNRQQNHAYRFVLHPASQH